ncbi:hypothetical protein M8J77_002047 [Diaphorina citri]|nr:hypothetical protein M8J77_002047 [Diaphorina citri]
MESKVFFILALAVACAVAAEHEAAESKVEDNRAKKDVVGAIGYPGDDVITHDSRFVCLCASVSAHFDIKSDVTTL